MPTSAEGLIGYGGPWLSRIVDPASRLISGGAQKLFSSLFRQRFLPPPPHSPTEEEAQPSENHLGNFKLLNCVLILSDKNAQAAENHLGNMIMEDPAWIRQREINEGSNQTNGSVTVGVVELENILKQMTFTRSERDRLTALLHSRTVDKIGISGERGFEEVSTSSLNHEKEMQGEMFSKGSLVEVSSDEDGYQGAWFAATVVQALKKGKYLIEYLELRTDDDTEFMKEELDALHIRPPPPKIEIINLFSLYEQVDALHNDGWWVGVVSKVLAKSKYLVYFKESNEELKLSHDELRPHQDWIDGEWVTTSKENIGNGLSALDSCLLEELGSIVKKLKALLTSTGSMACFQFTNSSS